MSLGIRYLELLRLTKQHYVTPRDENTLVMLVSLASL